MTNCGARWASSACLFAFIRSSYSLKAKKNMFTARKEEKNLQTEIRFRIRILGSKKCRAQKPDLDLHWDCKLFLKFAKNFHNVDEYGTGTEGK
jgi:hypothetical protein